MSVGPRLFDDDLQHDRNHSTAHAKQKSAFGIDSPCLFDHVCLSMFDHVFSTSSFYTTMSMTPRLFDKVFDHVCSTTSVRPRLFKFVYSSMFDHVFSTSSLYLTMSMTPRLFDKVFDHVCSTTSVQPRLFKFVCSNSSVQIRLLVYVQPRLFKFVYSSMFDHVFSTSSLYLTMSTTPCVHPCLFNQIVYTTTPV